MAKRHVEIEAYGAWEPSGPFLGLGLLAVLAGALLSCQPGETKDVAFQRVLPLCNELFRPNSTARPPGFDSTARLEEVSRQIREHAAEFKTPAGVRYLRARLEREPDEIARACIRRLLDDLSEGAA